MTLITYIGFSEIAKITILLVFTYIARYYYNYFTRPNPLPGPLPLPILGNLYLFHINNYVPFLNDCYKKYGETFEIYLGGERIISVANFELVDKVLSPSTKTNYKLRGKYNPGLKDYGISGYGIAWNHDYEAWHFNRQFFSQALLTPSFSQLAVNSTQKLYHELADYWNRIGEDQSTDIREWMTCYTTDNMYYLMMDKRGYNMSAYFTKSTGVETDVPKLHLKESLEFIEGFKSFKDGYIFHAFTNSFVRGLPGLKGLTSRYQRRLNEFFQLFLNIINNHKERIEKNDEGLKSDIMTLMLKYDPEQDSSFSIKTFDEKYRRPMNDKELVINMVEAAGAGIDSTAFYFTFTVYYLCHHPDVLDKIRDEAESVLGKDPRPVTMEDCEKFSQRFPYTDAALKEVARMSSLAPLIDRINVEPEELGGLKWHTYTHFIVNVVGIHNDRRYWKDPEKFLPERHLNPDEGYNPKALIIFGGGTRTCPGRKLAMIEIKILTVLAFLQYDFELVDKVTPLGTKYAFFTQPDSLPVKIRKRVH